MKFCTLIYFVIIYSHFIRCARYDYKNIVYLDRSNKNSLKKYSYRFLEPKGALVLSRIRNIKKHKKVWIKNDDILEFWFFI